MDSLIKAVPNFPGWELSSEGILFREGMGEVAPETYSNGDLKFRIDEGAWIFSGPCWKLMADVFYVNSPIGIEPEFVNGNRLDHSLDNLIFGEVNVVSGLWEPLPWKFVGSDRVFDRRLGRRIRVNETGEVFQTLVQAAMATGARKQNVSAVLHGRLGSTAGRTFSYVD